MFVVKLIILFLFIFFFFFSFQGDALSVEQKDVLLEPAKEWRKYVNSENSALKRNVVSFICVYRHECSAP